MDKGDPYIMIEKMVAATPQKSFLLFPCKASMETKATAAKTVRTNSRSAEIFLFSFFGANAMKITT